MIASLGMYDRAETAAANDRFWSLIRQGLLECGIKAPETLTRGEKAYWPAWQSPDLVLSQTCGYPYRARLHPQVALIGTPDYALPGCPPGHYNSVFLCRAQDDRQGLESFRRARFAFNDELSQSGWAAPQNHARSMGFYLHPSLKTGGHRLSALAVVEGRADYAALDALTFAMCHRYDPFMADLREIGRTAPTPGLPYIAARNADVAATFAAVQGAIAGLTPQDRDTLSLRDLARIAPEAYLAVPTPPAPDQIAQME